LPAVNAKGMGSMLETAEYSRGMMLFYVCAVILIAFPFVNKQIKSLLMIPFAILLARGIMRLGEQDIVKLILSIPYGVKIGFPVAIALIGISAILFVPTYLMRKLKIIKPEIDDSLEEYFKKGIKKGYDVNGLKKALYGQGVSKIDVDDAAQSVTSSPIIEKLKGMVKKDSYQSIRDYFESGMKKGYSIESLKLSLRHKGISDSVIKRAAKSFESSGKPEEYLAEYIRKGLDQGYKIDSLKSALLKQGVNSKDIEEAIKKV
jgi:SOS response regulatory protein OraA/RecX